MKERNQRAVRRVLKSNSRESDERIKDQDKKRNVLHERIFTRKKVLD